MNKIFRNKRIVFVWFVSYMVILFLSVFVNFIAYLRIESSISLQNGHYVTEILENRKNGIDNLRRLASNVAMEISHNHEIEDVAISAESKGMAYQEIIEVSRALSVYKNIDSEFNDIYVYFHNSDYCTGLYVSNNSANFYDVHIGSDKMERSRWIELMRSNHTGDFVVEYPKNGNPYVAYMLSVYGTERFMPYATVVVEMDYTKFFPVSTNEKYNESFYIIDEDGRILISEKRQQESVSQQVFDKYGIEEGIYSAGNQVIVCTNSENSEWKYVYLMDKAVFRKTINQAREIILIFNLICIIIASLVAWMLTKRNYKPISKIINIFGGDEVNEFGFNYIENKVNDIVRENEAYSYITEKLQNNVVKGAFLSRLLTEKIFISNKEEILDALGIHFLYDNYMVILFYVEITDEMFFDNRNENSEEEYLLARLAITNVMNDLIADSKCSVQYCDIEGMLGCILNIENKDKVNELVESVRFMQKILRENLNIEFMAGLSNLHGSIDRLPECYNEAMRCVEQYFFNANDLVRYSDLDDEDTAVFDFYISETAREQLVAAMQIGNYKACEEIINKIFEKSVINTGKSVRSVKCVLYEIAATMIRTITETGNFENEQNTVSELVGMIENAGTGVDAPEIRDHILCVIKKFCEQNSWKPVQKMDMLAEKAKHYVDEHYSDSELTVAKISEHCCVSMAYLSTSFKKKYNVGLLEYINYVRIDHSKKILADESYTVERVAKTVGFNNTRSYFRMFSRFVGTSPQKYRTMIISGEYEASE